MDNFEWFLLIIGSGLILLFVLWAFSAIGLLRKVFKAVENMRAESKKRRERWL